MAFHALIAIPLLGSAPVGPSGRAVARCDRAAPQEPQRRTTVHHTNHSACSTWMSILSALEPCAEGQPLDRGHSRAQFRKHRFGRAPGLCIWTRAQVLRVTEGPDLPCPGVRWRCVYDEIGEGGGGDRGRFAAGWHRVCGPGPPG